MQLRNLQDTDFNFLLRLFTDDIVRQYLGGALSSTKAVERVDKLLREKPKNYWVVVVEDNPIGSVVFGKHIDSGETELSYQLLPEWTGRGFALEAVEALLKENDASIVAAETQAANIRSRNLLEKLGFREIERLERFGEQQVYYELHALFGGKH